MLLITKIKKVYLLPLLLVEAGADKWWTFDDGVSAPVVVVGGGPDNVVADTEDVIDEAVEYCKSQLLLLLLLLLLLFVLLLWDVVWSELELKPVWLIRERFWKWPFNIIKNYIYNKKIFSFSKKFPLIFFIK